MRIGLTMRVVGARAYHETRDALSHDWTAWLEPQGHLPILIPNGISDAGAYLDALGVEALVLTGGNDLIPRPDAADRTSALRNRTEAALIDAACARDLPVLATCRGFHLVNDYFGGGLIADIRGEHPGAADHVAATHPVRLTPFFAGIAGADTIDTNSFHNQGVGPDLLAQELRAFAVSATDGLIEGAVHRRHPVIALQWHPERPGPSGAFDRAILARLLEKGCFWQTDPQSAP